MALGVDPGVPREQQTLRLPESKLASLREWAIEGTGLTAAARVTDPDDRIALVKNRWSDGWILPGGGVEPGGDPIDAARREVREETGLAATIGDPLLLVDQTYVSRRDGEERFSGQYVVYSARAGGTIPDADDLGETDDEISAAQWFDALPDDLHDGDLLRPYL
ncbi:NUDIX hydrolase [Halosolutus amylolyticus]|uniref:NUDIX hydrolase n=1 Tax=Halosolutus amylolyticus TaxID=2932267 RepID=A0ABD5PSC3_9EURY|nr:NUDIX hydrolase [Halosolutus amylolyticus]